MAAPIAYIPGVSGERPTASLDALGFDEAFETGLRLFREGFPWEAHEHWEHAWHLEGREGVRADLLKALIKLAAARVKLAQGNAVGVRTHAEGALRLFRLREDESELAFDLAKACQIAQSLIAHVGVPIEASQFDLTP